MERFEVGMLAVSKAGHDKDILYVIIRAEKEYVYLVDGIIRTLNKPKKKNIKHIQIVKHVDEDLQNKLIENNNIQNEDIKRVIKLFRLKQNN
jgi:ribosomal protein L14E/L6E/L27E